MMSGCDFLVVVTLSATYM